MKYIYSLFILLSNLLFAQYDVENETANTVAYWNKGDVFEYEVIQSKYNYKRYDTISKSQNKYDLTITVLDSTANSYTLKWESKIIFPEDNPAIKQYIDKHLKELNDFTILYQTDEFGSVTKLLNREDIKKTYRKIFDNILKNEKNIDEIKKITNQFIDNDEYFDNYLMQDLNQYHQFYGNQFSKIAVTNDVEIASPLTNNPIQLKQIYKLSDIDQEEETYTIRMDQLVDEEKMMGNILEKFSKKEEQIMDMSFLINIKQITHNSGVIFYSIFSKVVDVEGESKSVVKEFLIK